MAEWIERIKRLARRNRLVRVLLIAYYVVYFAWRDFGRSLLRSRKYAVASVLALCLVGVVLWFAPVRAEDMIMQQETAGATVSGGDAPGTPEEEQSGEPTDGAGTAGADDRTEGTAGEGDAPGDAQLTETVSGGDAPGMSGEEQPTETVSGGDAPGMSGEEQPTGFADGGDAPDTPGEEQPAESADGRDAPDMSGEAQSTEADAKGDMREDMEPVEPVDGESASEDLELSETADEEEMTGDLTVEPMRLVLPTKMSLKLNPWAGETPLTSEPVRITNYSSFDVELTVKNVCVTVNHDGETEDQRKGCSITLSGEADFAKIEDVMLSEGNSGELFTLRIPAADGPEGNSVTLSLNGEITRCVPWMWKDRDIGVSISIRYRKAPTAVNGEP